MKSVSFLFFVLLAVNLSAQSLSLPFNPDSVPSKPDYKNEKYWSALPWRDDVANRVPSESFKSNQDSALVDVFFIHPTTINSKYDAWNANVNDAEVNDKTDRLPVMHQSSVFNGDGKVYAPRYRQANYEAFMDIPNPNSQMAFNLAYSDVKEAFLHYMETWNNGRPFIIAAHSQGTFHGMRLIEELIDTTKLRLQLVAAYLVGMPVMEDKYKNIPPCENEFDTGCFLSWNTMKKKSYPKFYEEYFKGAVCHNPLSWSCNDDNYCDRQYHKGGVPHDFKTMFNKRYGAVVNDGILWVDAVRLPKIPFTKLVKNWHIGDYNLFYVNIRDNFALRVNEFLKVNPQFVWQTISSE